MRITIESPIDVITLDDAGRDPRHVWAIKKDGVTGLFGTPSTRESALDRPQMDGAYWPSRLTQGSRSISLDCVILGASSLEAARARDRINALVCQPLTLTVQDANGSRHTTCWLAADPEPLMRRYMSAFEFGLVLTCPDPYLYGDWQWQTANGNTTVTVDNTGTAPTWLRFESSSRIKRLYVTYGSQAEFEWEGDTSAFSLDTRDMIPSSGQVVADWAEPIQPGRATLKIQSDCSALKVGIRPAWR